MSSSIEHYLVDADSWQFWGKTKLIFSVPFPKKKTFSRHWILHYCIRSAKQQPTACQLTNAKLEGQMHNAEKTSSFNDFENNIN